MEVQKINFLWLVSSKHKKRTRVYIHYIGIATVVVSSQEDGKSNCFGIPLNSLPHAVSEVVQKTNRYGR